MIILRLNLKPQLVIFGGRKLLSHQGLTSNPIFTFFFFLFSFFFFFFCLLLLIIKETYCSSHTLTQKTLTQKVIWASTNMIWIFGFCAYSSLSLGIIHSFANTLHLSLMIFSSSLLFTSKLQNITLDQSISFYCIFLTN